MYSIYQTSQNNEEKIIGEIDNPDNFITFIRTYLANVYPDYVYLESETIETVKNDQKYDENSYLLNKSNILTLVSKRKKISEGYIYNSSYYEIEKIFIWRLISREILVKSEPKYINSIRTFDFCNVKKNSSFVICSKKETGKTWLINKFVNMLNINSGQDNFIQNTLFICPSEKMNPFYSLYFPNAMISYCYDEDVIDNHIKNGKGCLVLDDCLTPLQYLDINEKNHNIPIVATLQLHNIIINGGVYKFDYYVFMKEENKTIRENLWFMTRKLFPSFQDFDSVFDHFTQNYGAILIDRKNNSTDISQKVFSYRADYINSDYINLEVDKMVESIMDNNNQIIKNFVEKMEKCILNNNNNNDNNKV